MFEKWAERLNQKVKANTEEITFKEYNEEKDTKAAAKAEPAPASASLNATASATGNIELKLAKPESFADVAEIADYLLDGCTVVLNMESMEKNQGLRMLDFLNGVTYTTGGDIKPVAQNTYIISPNNVDIKDEV